MTCVCLLNQNNGTVAGLANVFRYPFVCKAKWRPSVPGVFSATMPEKTSRHSSIREVLQKEVVLPGLKVLDLIKISGLLEVVSIF